MNRFSWYEANSVETALRSANRTVSEELYEPSGGAVVLKAGGVDLLDLMKEGLVKPEGVVNILGIPGLRGISYDNSAGLRIGANTTLAEIEAEEAVRGNYRALHQAVASAATPQLRNMATLGGNLAQRTRCWYFRSKDHPCLRKNGDKCFAKRGENENHAIINNGGCVSVHASSISTALLAFEARVGIVNARGEEREVPVGEFFVAPGVDPGRENILGADELITYVALPTVPKNTYSYYIKEGVRKSYDWSIADVAVVIERSGNTCSRVRIALGSAAPTPMRSSAAEEELTGKAISEESAGRAAKAAMGIARPLSQNAYKVPLFESIIKAAILELA